MRSKEDQRVICSRLLLLVILLAFFAEMFVSTFFLFPAQRIGKVPLLYLVVRIPLVLLTFLMFIIYQMVSRLEVDHERQEWDRQQTQLQLEQNLELISSLQAQRHEFRNQLQVLHSMILLDKRDKLAEYIQECCRSLDDAVNLYKIENAVLQALFLTAQSKARELGIQFTVECRADLKAFAQSSVKVFRIFSNLLQNALEAATLDRRQPAVVTAIRQDGSGYQFSIWNSGPAIPAEQLGRLFEAGFSTKAGEEHQGYGLYIVKNLCEELGGAVEICNREGGGVEYLVRLPSARQLDAMSSERLA